MRLTLHKNIGTSILIISDVLQILIECVLPIFLVFILINRVDAQLLGFLQLLLKYLFFEIENGVRERLVDFHSFPRPSESRQVPLVSVEAVIVVLHQVLIEHLHERSVECLSLQIVFFAKELERLINSSFAFLGIGRSVPRRFTNRTGHLPLSFILQPMAVLHNGLHEYLKRLYFHIIWTCTDVLFGLIDFLLQS